MRKNIIENPKETFSLENHPIFKDLEINKDEYLSEGIISIICYGNSKEIIIQE